MSGQISLSTQSHISKDCLAAYEVGHLAQKVTYTDAWTSNKHKYKWALDTTDMYLKKGNHQNKPILALQRARVRIVFSDM